MTLLALAKGMRAEPTDAEHRVWQNLRAERLGGFKFRRQEPMGNYILDFVCYERRVIVELDGGQHGESNCDLLRDDWLRRQGFVILRFWNSEVFENLEGVLERTLAQLQALPPSPQPLARSGRGARRRPATVPASIDALRPLPSLPLDGGGIEGEGDVSSKYSNKNGHRAK